MPGVKIDSPPRLCSNEAMSETSQEDLLRQIPAVDHVLQLPRVYQWVERTSRNFVVSEIQTLLREVRDAIRAGRLSDATDSASLEQLLDQRIESRLRRGLVPVINATGVILHTNLGRAPLSVAAQQSLSAIAGQFTNLEYNNETGARSHRDQFLEKSLTEILGCEAATVVNNNAAAVFLILNTLAAGREVVVSRGELVEIGGAFRIPDILARSGAVLREVGTTNKTRIQDYAEVINQNTALILRVHPSNYRILGFTHRPDLGDMLELAHRHQIPLVEDLGSGCLVDLTPYGITDEPVAQKSAAAGVDLICFSGDKLLGGPQAGIIAGARQLIDAIRKNPLMRTYRVEKLIYSALEATLGSYRQGRALEEIPTLRMISTSQTDLRRRVRSFTSRLRKKLPEGARVEIADGNSVVGGGSCPECNLPTVLLTLESRNKGPQVIASLLRRQRPPIVLRVEEDHALVDLRTVFPDQEGILLSGLVNALS